ncbi:hypothetical protein P4S72_29355 [Vibrio sp. PP-XX7]
MGLYPIEESLEVYGRMWKFSYSVTPLFIHQLRLPAPLYIAFRLHHRCIDRPVDWGYQR